MEQSFTPRTHRVLDSCVTLHLNSAIDRLLVHERAVTIQPGIISLEYAQELVAISKPGVPRRSLSALCGVKPCSTIVLVLAQSMNS